jgi:hypothetical protein
MPDFGGPMAHSVLLGIEFSGKKFSELMATKPKFRANSGKFSEL